MIGSRAYRNLAKKFQRQARDVSASYSQTNAPVEPATSIHEGLHVAPAVNRFDISDDDYSRDLCSESSDEPKANPRKKRERTWEEMHPEWNPAEEAEQEVDTEDDDDDWTDADAVSVVSESDMSAASHGTGRHQCDFVPTYIDASEHRS